MDITALKSQNRLERIYPDIGVFVLMKRTELSFESKEVTWKFISVDLTIEINRNSKLYMKRRMRRIMNLTEQESIFCQALAITSLLTELSDRDFLNSDYYKKYISFTGNNAIFKEILDRSRLGNPATMQMFLYILLVMPKETLSGLNNSTISSWGNELKTKIPSFSPVVTTTYLGESNSNLTTIDYYRHIRNAVSHSKCVYKTENGRCYVTFIDEKPKQASQHCEIKMLTSDVGKMLGLLQKQIMTYLNAQWSKRSMEKSI